MYSLLSLEHTYNVNSPIQKKTIDLNKLIEKRNKINDIFENNYLSNSKRFNDDSFSK